MLGAVLYEGPSLLTGDPIVAILTGLGRSSKNAKIGDMLQTWILRADMEPTEAIRAEADSAICGECPLKGSFSERRCYVNVGQGPLQVYRAWKRGAYAPYATRNEMIEVTRGQKVRLGAYGDPAAVPVWVWEQITCESAGWTGYTHQWRNLKFDPRILDYCMASVEDEKGIEQLGFLFPRARYFRVRAPGEERLRGEQQCPAANEAGKKLTCAECLVCDGGAKAGIGFGGQRSVSLAAHGRAGFERNWE